MSTAIIGTFRLLQTESYVHWLLRMLGPLWGFLIPLAGGVVFLGAFFVVLVSRKPRVIAAFFVFLPLPFILALFAAFSRQLASLSVLAASTANPTAAQWSEGLSAMIVPLLVAIHLTLPSYLLLSLGLLITTMIAARRQPG